MTPCYSCTHATPHKAEGPRDRTVSRHNDKCEECDCFNDPTFDPETGIRHSLDDHGFEPQPRMHNFCAYVIFGVIRTRCNMPRREHSR